MFTPEFRNELKAIVREVVKDELQSFADCLMPALDKGLTEAFDPCLKLLLAIDKNQTLISDGQCLIEKSFLANQQKPRDDDDDEPWRESLHMQDDDAGE